MEGDCLVAWNWSLPGATAALKTYGGFTARLMLLSAWGGMKQGFQGAGANFCLVPEALV